MLITVFLPYPLALKIIFDLHPTKVKITGKATNEKLNTSREAVGEGFYIEKIKGECLRLEVVKFGSPPDDTHVRDIRLEKSVELIKDSDMNISETVYSVGFTNGSYLSKILKRKYKCMPG